MAGERFWFRICLNWRVPSVKYRIIAISRGFRCANYFQKRPSISRSFTSKIRSLKTLLSFFSETLQKTCLVFVRNFRPRKAFHSPGDRSISSEAWSVAGRWYSGAGTWSPRRTSAPRIRADIFCEFSESLRRWSPILGGFHLVQRKPLFFFSFKGPF